MNQQPVHSETTRWLEKYVEETFSMHIPLTDPSFQSVWNFLFLWGLYEAELMNNHTSARNVWNNCGVFAPEVKAVDHFYEIIHQRYVDENQHINVVFDQLCFREEEGKYKDDIKSFLLSANTSDEEKNKVCRMILWRYRNNLFHGKKELKSIWKQLDFFEEANVYLKSGLENKTGIRL